MADTQKIYVSPSDDIHAVITKIEAAEAPNIDLIVPSGAVILQNIVDAYLLRDIASSGKKEIKLVTNDMMGKLFAERAGISVSNPTAFPTARTVAARMSDIVPQRRGARKAKAAAPAKKAVAPKNVKKEKSDAAAEAEFAKTAAASDFLKNYKKERQSSEKDFNVNIKQTSKKKGSKLTPGRVTAGILIIVLLLAGTVLARVLPKGEVVIHPVRAAGSFTAEVAVDSEASSVDTTEKVIPGELLTKEEVVTQTFEATGADDSAGKARGAVTIYNEYSAQPQTFVPSRFQAENGLIFWTQERVVVPGATIQN